MNANVLDSQLYVVARLVDENIHLHRECERLRAEITKLAEQLATRSEVAQA